MGTLQEHAKQFRSSFQCDSSWSHEAFHLQLALILEESKEVKQAALWFEKSMVAVAEREDLLAMAREDLLKELADLVFVCFQMAEYLGWDLDEAMLRVFESNMSKLDKDGNVIRREDGKVLKGPNYIPPCLVDLAPMVTV